MPVEMEVWRVDQTPQKLNNVDLNYEERLNQWIFNDISIAAPDSMAIGREVNTGFGRIDILGIDFDGNLVVLELKRGRSPRDVVAQILEYASWAHNLKPQDVYDLYANYLLNKGAIAQACANNSEKTDLFSAAFKEHFKANDLPEAFDNNPDEPLKNKLLIVATELDSRSERIIKYLRREFNLPINVAYFKFYTDDDREYISRCWLEDPSSLDTEKDISSPAGSSWNNEYYVSFGLNGDWDAAIKYGYIASGGGVWYTRTLDLLHPGDRIWVNTPRHGYVGVAEVKGNKTKITDFKIKGKDGQPDSLLLDFPDCPPYLHKNKDDDELASYMVPVRWIKTVPLHEAVGEAGLFGNQNTVCRPKTPKWAHTVKRLKEIWSIS